MAIARAHRRTLASTLLIAVAATLAACGGTTAGSPSASAPGSLPAGPAAGVTAEPPVARPVPDVVVSAHHLHGQPVAVTGFFTTDGTVHKVCDAVLESYPPQCGGSTIVVLGTIPPQVLDALESTADQPDPPGLAQVWWGDVEIRGVLRAPAGTDAPTLDLVEMRVVDRSG